MLPSKKVRPTGVEMQTISSLSYQSYFKSVDMSSFSESNMQSSSRKMLSSSDVTALSSSLRHPVGTATGAIYNNIQDTSRQRLPQWIRSNFKKRVCCAYKPKNQSDGAVCGCGYAKHVHSKRALQNRIWHEKWSDKTDTTSEKTDAFGEMEFVGFGQRIGKYIRVDHQTDLQPMLTLMTDHWRLPTPNLLISVTGGAKNFHMKPRLKEVFCQGLMKAAQSTGAWIITGGMHAGVMKHVGEAVHDHTLVHGSKAKIVAIGIATWGCVKGKSALVNKNGCWPTEYKDDYSEMVSRESALDANHSHFVLVDNGTQHQFGVEIPFRAKLERQITQMKTNMQDDDAVSIPIVSVVLEGGPGTLETVVNAIQSGTPAVIVQGSGRTADILAFAYANTHDDENSQQSSSSTWSDVRAMIEKDFGTKDLDRNVSWVKECMRKRDHLTVFQLDSSDSATDIDRAVLQALLKAKKGNVHDQLKLALAWNRIDIARSEILTDDLALQAHALDRPMLTALISNRADFVKLFLENGVSLRSFLTLDRLLVLYHKIPENSMLYMLLEKQKKDKSNTRYTLEDIGRVLKVLMGDFFTPHYLSSVTTPEKANSRPSVPPPLGANNEEIPQNVPAEGCTSCLNKSFFQDPTLDLFIWSILRNHFELAMLFWEEGKEGIAAALMAQRLLASMQSRTKDPELANQIMMQVEHFKQLAVGVLSECYASDEGQSQLLLVRELPNFGGATPILLAVEADNKPFIAHVACQELFNDIWMGSLSPDNGSLWASALCLPLVYCLIDFKRQALKPRFEDDRKSEAKMKRIDTQDSLMKEKTTLERKVSLEEEESRGKGTGAAEEANFGCWEKLNAFLHAPVAIFIINAVSYSIFLILFSISLLTDFQRTFSVKDYIIVFWVVTLITEEIRQVLSAETRHLGEKITDYLSDQWNILDTSTLFVFLVGVVLRIITPQCARCHDAARVVFAINLMLFFFRLLHIFSVHRHLGPKLVMIRNMLVDLAYFTIILMVFVIAYGVASQAILYPNSKLHISLIRDILRKSYFHIYGELFLDELEGTQDCVTDAIYFAGNSTLPRCPTKTWVVPILFGIYILFANVLMINLLIAIFSYTFNKIQNNTDLYWFYQRYFLVKEYYERPPLAPPIIIVWHIYLLFWHCCRRCCHKRVRNDFRCTYSESVEKQLILWENMNVDEYIRRVHLTERQSLENRVKDTAERVDIMMDSLDELIEDQTGKSSGQLTTPVVSANTAGLEQRLAHVEKQIKSNGVMLQTVLNLLKDIQQKAASS